VFESILNTNCRVVSDAPMSQKEYICIGLDCGITLDKYGFVYIVDSDSSCIYTNIEFVSAVHDL